MIISLVIILAMSPYIGTDLPKRSSCTIRAIWYYLGSINIIDAKISMLKMSIQIIYPRKCAAQRIESLPPTPLFQRGYGNRLIVFGPRICLFLHNGFTSNPSSIVIFGPPCNGSDNRECRF